jgi:phosphoribosylamine--glycine ligase
VADEARKAGIPVFGPGRSGARLEASKDFSKQFMLRHGVATARAKTFDNAADAAAYARSLGQVVVKADGLAAGKGVILPQSEAELVAALDECFVQRSFGAAGDRVLIEEFMPGEELSLLCFCDGKALVPMVGAQDHKRVNDGDQGPNTGGMGAYSPAPVLSDAVLQQVRERILDPTMRGLLADGIDFRGCLYVGLMITPEGPKVVEYNARFGDPETQVVLPRAKFDLAQAMLDCANGALDASSLKWSDDACVCVVLASGGYPGPFAKGKRISGLAELGKAEGVLVFHAGSKKEGGEFVTNGGRVLGVTATGREFKQALERAYSAVAKISFEGMHFRKDIGHRALTRN